MPYRVPNDDEFDASTVISTVAEIGRTLSKPVKFVLTDKYSEHKCAGISFGKRKRNKKSKASPAPRIMNHMVERNSQNDVPEEMDITEGKRSDVLPSF